MARLILDATAIVALMDTGDAHHRAAREAVAAFPSSTSLAACASVYAEVLVRASALGVAERFEHALTLMGLDIVPLDRPLARRAALLRASQARPRLSLSDALALAPALAHDPPLPFLTFDDAQQRRYEAEVAQA